MTCKLNRRLSAAITALLGLTLSCGGNYSNRDLEFLYALPDRQQLSAKLPQSGTSASPLMASGTSAINIGDVADYYQSTHDAASSFNGGLAGLLGLVEAIAKVPPSARSDSSRTWGPWPDKDHPGFEVEMVMDKVAEGQFAYRIEFSPTSPHPSWFSVVSGQFTATADITRGKGKVRLDAATARNQGLSLANLSSVDSIDITYATDGPPTSVQLQIALSPSMGQPGPTVSYAYREFESGKGWMNFLYSSGSPVQSWSITARWLPDGEGQADGRVIAGPNQGAAQTECWDTTHVLRYLSQNWPAGAQAGSSSFCPADLPAL